MHFEKTIYIAASPEKVWDALINPEMTVQYMFGCQPVTDWIPGSKLIWRGAADGVDYVTGNVVKFEPPSVLAFTTFNPNGGEEDVPENHLLGEYRLEAVEGGTNLRIIQGDFSKVANGEQRYKESVQAWEMTLGILKKLLEA